uniref:Conotoxin n=2 Tax=Conus andremenezi TaxID=1077466 RepID=A0A291C1Q6_9COND|nr:conotoxin [Conus andremenezi]
MMFRLTTVSCFLLVIVLLNLVVLTDACYYDVGDPCSSNEECCISECCYGICLQWCTWPVYKRGRRHVSFKVFGQR